MINRLRDRFGAQGYSPGASRYVSRRDREETQRRLLIIGVSAAAILVVSILAVGAFYQYVYLPGRTLATVNGVEIEQGDYWKVRRLELLGQIGQYQQLAQFSEGEQAQQYQQLASQASAQLRTVESDPVDPNTLDQMVNDQVILQSMDELGVEITEQDIDDYMTQAFTGVTVGETPPPLDPDPTAAAWAEATAEAMATPEATEAAEGEDAEVTPAEGESEDSESGEAGAATPEAEEGTPVVETPESTPTPSADEARATATAVLDEYEDNVLSEADMSVDEFRELYVLPAVARERVQYELASEIPVRAEQVHAAHILVATEEAANVLVNETLPDRDFAEVAREQSADTATAANGGDLGWFPRGVMVDEFEEVAFSLEPGEISDPVETRFGWHVIKVIDREEDRPVTVDTLQSLRGQVFNEWLEERRAEANVDWQIDREVPTQEPSTQFGPPPDAPPAPTPTPMPTPTPAPAEDTEDGGDEEIDEATPNP